VLSGVSIFIQYKTIDIQQVVSEYYRLYNIQPVFDTQKMQTFTSSYMPLLLLLFLPFQSIFTWVAFSKWGNNYYEHIVMNAFLLSLIIILNIVVVYPILYLLQSSPFIFMSVQSLLSFIIMIFSIFWFFIGFYHDQTFEKIFLRLLLFIGLFIVFVVILSMLVAVVGFFFYGEKIQKMLMLTPK